jgi:hypothetical protein
MCQPSQLAPTRKCKSRSGERVRLAFVGGLGQMMERETGVEPATSTLAKWIEGPATTGADRR